MTAGLIDEVALNARKSWIHLKLQRQPGRGMGGTVILQVPGVHSTTADSCFYSRKWWDFRSTESADMWCPVPLLTVTMSYPDLILCSHHSTDSFLKYK